MLQKRSKGRVFLIFMLLVLLIGFGAVNASAARIRLKYAHQNNVYDADQLCAETFKSIVEAETNGEITVTIYPGTLTTSEEEAMEYMRAGTMDIGANSAGHISGFYKDIQFLQLPYLFKSREHYYVARRSAVLQEILDELGKAVGLVPLGIYSDCNGLAIASTKPIHSLRDARGMKLRSMQNPLFIDMYEAWGFNVTPTDWGELYTAMQTGLVEANDLGAYCQYVFKLAEVAKAMAVTQHCWTQKVIFIAPKTWNRMNSKQKEIVRSAAEQAIELTDQFQYVKEDMALEKAKEQGYTVTYPDLNPFKKASENVYDKWFRRYPHWEKWYEQIQYLDPDARTPKAGMPKIE